MVEYGLMVSKSSGTLSGILSDCLIQLRSFWDTMPLQSVIAIAVIVVIAFFLIRSWLAPS